MRNALTVIFLVTIALQVTTEKRHFSSKKTTDFRQWKCGTKAHYWES
jgi:hypothetical protein